MAILARYFLDVENRVPAAKAKVARKGAILNGAQSSSPVTVFEGHELGSSDKFLYAPNRNTVLTAPVFTVSGSTTTTVTFSPEPTFEFVDGGFLVNIMDDGGGVVQSDGSYTLPDWDGDGRSVYTNPGGSGTPNTLIEPEVGNEFGWYGTGYQCWLVVVDSGDRPVRFYTDLGPQAGSIAVVDNLDTGTQIKGRLLYLDNGDGVGDQLYVYGRDSNDDSDWTEIIDMGVGS